MLVLLAFPAIAAGFLAFGGEFQSWVLGALPDPEEGHFEFDVGVFLASTVAAAAGIGAAVAVYQRRLIDVAALREGPLRPLHRALENKLYMDVLVEDWLVRRFFYGGLAKAAARIDAEGVDRVLDGIWQGGFEAGRWGRLVQNGQVQTMAVALTAGGVVIWGVVVIFWA